MQDKLPALRRLRGRDFLTDLDFAREDLEDMLSLAVVLKKLWRTKPLTPFLPTWLCHSRQVRALPRAGAEQSRRRAVVRRLPAPPSEGASES